jgi:hypothetical protein
MDLDRNKRPGPHPSNRVIWILGGVIVVLLVVFSLNGLIRGTGESAGVTQAAPGDDNATPAPEARPGQGH